MLDRAQQWCPLLPVIVDFRVDEVIEIFAEASVRAL